MEEFILNNAIYAHWLIFGLFILAGLNVPISEDILILGSAVLASNVIPENTWKLMAAILLGAYISDWMVYFIGRVVGPKLSSIKWFKKSRIEKIQGYYRKYGALTLLLGRFIPFGVRNCLFVCAGIAKMPFWKFFVFDGIACLASTTTLFSIAYFFGKSFTKQLNIINIVIFSLFVGGLVGFIIYKRKVKVDDA